MDKLKMHSPDMSQQNIEKIRTLFPNCVTESRTPDGSLRLAVDFDLLKQELSDSIVEGPQERYHLNWPGKRQALLTANAPIAKTLRPCREDSVNFDTTQNLFIEGDNLDALKLLQEAFLDQIKMIYIDPPYNRKKGNDLIYRDDFVGNSFEHLKRTNQIDDEGRQLTSNTEANGRFHSDWLNMFYQRIKVSKNLLKKDGVILISIDDNETSNTRKVCDEVFGEENFLGTIIWKNVTDNNPTNIAIEHESIHIYAKSKSNLENVWKSKVSAAKDTLVEIGENLVKKFSDPVKLQEEYSSWFKENKSQLGALDRYKYIDNAGVYTGSQSVHNPGSEGYRYDVLHPETGKPCKEPLMGYRFPESTMERLLKEDRILFGKDHNKIIELKVYAKDFEDKLSSVFELDGRIGPYDLRALFPESPKVFSNPKPVSLIERFCSFIVQENEVVMDMFAGSATLAHAVMNLNSIDGKNRKHISIQFPEKIDGKTKDSKVALKFCVEHHFPPLISEISKERIRRAGKKILEGECHKDWNQDVGFRVLKVDTSNMADIYYSPDAIGQGSLDLLVDNIKPDRTEEDLLFQVLLDWGIDLTLPIRKDSLCGKTVYNVDDGALVACFDRNITEDLLKAMAEQAPLRVVFRDDGFATDSLKINAEQMFKQLAPGTDVRAI